MEDALGTGRWSRLEQAQLAAEASLALASTLHLRRTLGRVVTLLVPRLAEWSAVTMVQPLGGTRVVGVSTAQVGRPYDRVRHGNLPEPSRSVVSDPATLVEYGADGALAALLLAAGPVHLLALRLRTHSGLEGLLALASPRPFDQSDLAIVADLAERAALAISAARIYEERTVLATTLRDALLPPRLPGVPGVELGSRYRSALEATEIGGDFYDVYPVEGGWAFAIGDVCGKGVEAAVLTGRARQSLRTACLINPDPEQVLRLLNRVLLETDGSQFLTIVYGHLRPADGGGLTLRLANGGHPPPLVLRRDGSVETVEVPRGMLVGMLSEADFAAVDVTLAPGETLLVYTDGVTEARDSARELLGVERLATTLASCAGMSAQAIVERLEQLALDYLGGRSHDDIALLAVRAPQP